MSCTCILQRLILWKQTAVKCQIELKQYKNIKNGLTCDRLPFSPKYFVFPSATYKCKIWHVRKIRHKFGFLLRVSVVPFSATPTGATGSYPASKAQVAERHLVPRLRRSRAIHWLPKKYGQLSFTFQIPTTRSAEVPSNCHCTADCHKACSLQCESYVHE